MHISRRLVGSSLGGVGLSLIFMLGLLVWLAGSPATAPEARAQAPEKRQPARQVPSEDLADANPVLVTKDAVCTWADQPPLLDGKLDDDCWKKGKAIVNFASFWSSTPRMGTKAYLAWDDDALYYAGHMTDNELRSFGDHRNDSLWNGDVFELFFKPRTDKPEYYEFQANPKALVFEVGWPRRGHNYGDLARIPALGSKALVAIEGSLDHPGDDDKAWTVEARIPWTAFALTGGKPKVGDVWSFALCRYDYGPKGTEPILMSSAPLTKPSFHQYEDYGKLRFEGPSR
jgi:hypothetical protein